MRKYKQIFLVLLAGLLFSCNNQTNEDSSLSKVEPVKAAGKNYPDKNDTSKIDSQNNITPVQPNSSKYETDKLIEDGGNLTDAYNQLDKPFQVFVISNNKDTTLICKEGTSLKIKAKSFAFEKTGKEVIGSNINVSIKEYYKLSDIILAKLSTKNNANLLETAGMVYITASANNENCSLKTGQKIEIGFPSKEKKEDMQLYLGDWKSDYQINWDVVPESKDLNKIYSTPDVITTFPGGQSQMTKFISKNIKYPENAKIKGIQGTVYLSFIVERDGSVSNLKVIRGIESECNQEALRVVKQFPKFIPAKSNGENVKTNFILPIRFSLGESVAETNTEYKEKFENKYNETTIQSAEVNELSRYVFTTTKLDWINCDRLWKNINAPRINYMVNAGEYKSSNVDIVFHSYKSIYSGIALTKEFSFLNVPVGEDITIVAIKCMNNKLYLAIKEAKISTQAVKDLDFQVVTIETLKSKMRELDKLD